MWSLSSALDVAACCRLALHALAAGADINAAYRTPRAQHLVRNTSLKDCKPPAGTAAAEGGGGSRESSSSGGDSSTTGNAECASPSAAVAASGAAVGDQSPRTPTWHGCGTVTVLHAAAAAGNSVLMEFLLQNGASWQPTDVQGRTPLHYAILHDCVDCAKLLLKRSSDAAKAMDARGRTAMDLMMAKGRISDEELFLLLSS